MKNASFSVVDDTRNCGSLFTNLTSYVAVDPQGGDVYFERNSPGLNQRFAEVITPRQAIQRLKSLGFLRQKADSNRVVFRHQPSGQQLSIAINKKKVLIGSHFLATDDAPVAFLTDTRELLNELFGSVA